MGSYTLSPGLRTRKVTDDFDTDLRRNLYRGYRYPLSGKKVSLCDSDTAFYSYVIQIECKLLFFSLIINFTAFVL